ncbi:hypothetical protein [Tenacibaculum caenipelagi]|uniref:Uncharacterized protein n=1 Tax=Tenacibaculum caenipelagi TaxID=1325435 RepID=A0A4V3D301_9FLAO|nr:hypothetical protein [Tenacibaculum caenipelagi]TDQ25720.1 hypothetical protein DFQ07_2150 [Tenacibaculum caenipelagi]
MKKAQKTNIWKLLFIFTPVILFGNITEILKDKNIAFTFGLTIIGVALGFLVYYVALSFLVYFLTKKKSLTIKIISLSILIIIPLRLLFLMWKMN